MVLANMSRHLNSERARIFANEGVGRRLPLIARSAVNIFGIYPPNLRQLLSKEACDDVGIQLQAFTINVYAILDNVAWVCMLEANGSLPAMKVGLFKREMQPFLPAELRDYVKQPGVATWFEDYGKVYRDSTAHRIPPYLPSRTFTAAEGEKFSQLHQAAHMALAEAQQALLLNRTQGRELLDRHEALMAEKEQVGSNSLLFALSLSGTEACPPVYLHPQLLSDWALTNEVVLTFCRAISNANGWPLMAVPKLHVR